jgi:23S rRNA U2552 (ribose-2'-O)-methylase RlmE/FtsJ
MAQTTSDCKVNISQEEYYKQFYDNLRRRFKMTKAYAPEASRKRSAEVYVVGREYKG